MKCVFIRKNTKQLIIKSIVTLLVTMVLLTGCSSGKQANNDSESDSVNETSAPIEVTSAFEFNVGGNQDSVVFGNVLFYVDKTGVWKKERGKDNLQLSSFAGSSIATNGHTILYSYNDLDNSQGYIRCVTTEGKDDAEVCKTTSSPIVIGECDNRILYTAVNTDKPQYSIFAFDKDSKKESIIAEDVFKSSTLIDNKLVYLDSGGSEFSIVGKLHILDLTNGKDEQIDEADYDKSIYQEKGVVYSVKSDLGTDGKYTLCAYDLKTSESKELYTLLDNTASNGCRSFGVSNGSFYYAIEDYSVVNGNYTYYQYEIDTEKTTQINGLPHNYIFPLITDDGVVWYFDDSAYLYDGSLKKISNISDGASFVTYFDNELYSQSEDGKIEVYHYDASKATQQPDISSVVLESYLGADYSELSELFGDNYSYVELPESGLTECINFSTLPNVAFGLSGKGGTVQIISVKDCNDSVSLTDDITSDLTGSELLGIKNGFTVTENQPGMSDSSFIILKNDQGLILSFEWYKSSYPDSCADMIMMQRI